MKTVTFISFPTYGKLRFSVENHSSVPVWAIIIPLCENTHPIVAGVAHVHKTRLNSGRSLSNSFILQISSIPQQSASQLAELMYCRVCQLSTSSFHRKPMTLELAEQFGIADLANVQDRNLIDCKDSRRSEIIKNKNKANLILKVKEKTKDLKSVSKDTLRQGPRPRTNNTGIQTADESKKHCTNYIRIQSTRLASLITYRMVSN